jgi:hypothetical protein
MKKFITLSVCVIAVFSLLTITATATDYGFDPAYEITAVNTIEVSAILQAIEYNKPIILSGGEVKLTLSAVAAIANAVHPIVFKTADGILITIDPALITNAARAIDLNVKVSSVKTVEISGQSVNAVVVSPSAHGAYGFNLSLAIPVKIFDGLDVNNLNTYHIKNNSAVRELNTEVINENVVINFSEASEYIITDQTLPISAATVKSTSVRGSDRNPGTGVMLAFSGLAAAGVVMIFVKSKK